MTRFNVYVLTCVLFSFLSLNLNGQNSGAAEPATSRQISRLELVSQLSGQCWQNREKQTDKAIAYGLQAIGIAKAEGFQNELAQLYTFLGEIYRDYKYDVPTAMSYYDLALPIWLENKDSLQVAYIYNELAEAFLTLGNAPLAVAYTNKSKGIFERHGSKPGIASSYINLGYLSRMDRSYDKSLDCFQKALALRETLNDSAGIASATLEVGQTLSLMEKDDEAMRYYRKSLAKSLLIDNQDNMVYAMQGIADVFLNRNEVDSAKVYFEGAWKLARQRANPAAEIDSQLGIARLMAATGNVKEGEHLLADAFSNAQRLNTGSGILNVYKARAEFYQRLGDYRSASENYQSYLQAHDSLLSGLLFQTLSHLENHVQINQAPNRVTPDLKSKRKAQISVVLIIGIFLVLTLVFIFRNRIIARLSSELAEANQAKDKIFTIVSHDLVSPFNVLIGTSELLMEDLEEGDLESAKNNGRLIHSTSEEAYRLISNLLTWARSQRKTIKLVKERFDITHLALDVVAMFENHSELKGIELKVSAAVGIIVTADRNLVKIVLVNLVNNALKFTSRGGKISLYVQEIKGKVQVSVRDNGAGMSSDRLAHLFNHRAVEGAPAGHTEPDTGLGLLLCKEFVEMHGGQIYATSREGEGSEFTFSLPAV